MLSDFFVNKVICSVLKNRTASFNYNFQKITNLGFVASWLYLVHRECHLEEAAKPSYNWLQGY